MHSKNLSAKGGECVHKIFFPSLLLMNFLSSVHCLGVQLQHLGWSPLLNSWTGKGNSYQRLNLRSYKTNMRCQNQNLSFLFLTFMSRCLVMSEQLANRPPDSSQLRITTVAFFLCEDFPSLYHSTFQIFVLVGYFFHSPLHEVTFMLNCVKVW